MEMNISDKIYFSIGEVSSITKMESYTLRYWETEFNLLKPKKNKAGKRIYTKKDIENILYIKKLLYLEKYTIEGAKMKLRGTPYPERQQAIQEDIFEKDEVTPEVTVSSGASVPLVVVTSSEEEKEFLKSLKDDIILLQEFIAYNKE